MGRLILSKGSFFRKARAGLCGNVPRIWTSVTELEEAEPQPRFLGLRFLSFSHPGFCSALTKESVIQECRSFNEGSYVISESDGIGVDDEVFGLAGELTWVLGGWYLFYTLRLGWMRIRLFQDGKHLQGFPVLNLLKSSMCGSDYGHLMELFDYYTVGQEYPTIEFSVLRSPIGPDPRCLAIWEIRHGY